MRPVLWMPRIRRSSGSQFGNSSALPINLFLSLYYSRENFCCRSLSDGIDDMFKKIEGASMKSQRLFAALVIVNLAWLGAGFAKGWAGQSNAAATILRGRALELVDDQGRVRAEIKVFPAQPHVRMPDGTIGFPEIVQLRLITSKGGPNVKLGASEDGAGLSLVGEKGYVQVLSRGQEEPFVKIVMKDGREKVFKP